MVAGRSEVSLEGYLNRFEGKHLVNVVCMDLAAGYRSLVRKHFPQARIVADGFHVIRIVNQHFMACWKELDAAGSKNRAAIERLRSSTSPPSIKGTLRGRTGCPDPAEVVRWR